MEDINRNIQKANADTKSSGKINMCNTAGFRMGRQRFSDFYKNTTRNNRLEWRC
tara:strand:- start:316 stop:477 length:162 start_codon:yes stop_codon:yes gene_type:complete